MPRARNQPQFFWIRFASSVNMPAMRSLAMVVMVDLLIGGQESQPPGASQRQVVGTRLLLSVHASLNVVGHQLTEYCCSHLFGCSLTLRGVLASSPLDSIRLRGKIDLPGDVPGHQVDGEQVGDAAQPSVVIEAVEVGVGHARAQLGHALVGNPAFSHELQVSLEDRLGEELAAGDLDSELALQTEHDVQEVDRFRTKVAL